MALFLDTADSSEDDSSNKFGGVIKWLHNHYPSWLSQNCLQCGEPFKFFLQINFSGSDDPKNVLYFRYIYIVCCTNCKKFKSFIQFASDAFFDDLSLEATDNFVCSLCQLPVSQHNNAVEVEKWDIRYINKINWKQSVLQEIDDLSQIHFRCVQYKQSNSQQPLGRSLYFHHFLDDEELDEGDREAQQLVEEDDSQFDQQKADLDEEVLEYQTIKLFCDDNPYTLGVLDSTNRFLKRETMYCSVHPSEALKGIGQILPVVPTLLHNSYDVFDYSLLEIFMCDCCLAASKSKWHCDLVISVR